MISPTFTDGGGGAGGRHLLVQGSLSSLRSRHFLENAINWIPIVQKYRSLKEAPKDKKMEEMLQLIGDEEAAPPAVKQRAKSIFRPEDNEY